MTIGYAKKMVLESINFKLKEEKEYCERNNKIYSKENVKLEIFRSKLFHDNFLDIAGELSMTDTEKNNPVVGIREEFKSKHKTKIIDELWKLAE